MVVGTAVSAGLTVIRIMTFTHCPAIWPIFYICLISTFFSIYMISFHFPWFPKKTFVAILFRSPAHFTWATACAAISRKNHTAGSTNMQAFF